MSDFDLQNKVVLSNHLVQLSKWNLNAVPLKVFKTLISCIDTKRLPKNNTVCISKKELYDLLGSDEDTNYTYLREQVRSLQK